MDSEAQVTFTCDLRGKVALVTGGSGGIGAHLATVLADAGASVAVAARREERLAEIVNAIADGGGTALALRMDVTDPSSIEEAFERVERELGVVNVLINNAGIAVVQPALEADIQGWDRVLATNLRGPFLAAQACAKRLVARKAPGSIVNVGSIMGERVGGGLVSYAAAKAGLLHVTRALALEWARYRIRVNAIAPGYVETDINRGFFDTPAGAAVVKRIPQQRIGRLNDLDAVVLLLASDASSYMTGAVVPIDGGHLVSSL